ncbi:MAG: anti-sigma factor antagonist [Calditrichaeota bacterium]|nr:MAG: anti-sigma factor antagonist [Calditrichota bacterium]
MKYQLKESNDITVLCLEEERLDTNVAPDLKAQLLMLIDARKKVLLNLESVQYADSSGLGAILLGYRQARDLGARFAVCGMQKRVYSLFSIAQLDSRITIYKDEKESLQQMK